MAKKDSQYFQDFVNMISMSCRAAEHLQEALKHFTPETLERNRKLLHEIENNADKVKHDMRQRLIKEFVPPIDREDILSLAHEIDNVTDKIEDILIRMYMYNIQMIRPDAILFADVVSNCCQALHQAMLEFPNYHKSKILAQKIIDVNTMESEGDLIYIKAVRKLYTEGGDPIQVSVWSKLFDLFEDCCDTCEHVAEVLERVIMKNS